MTLCSGVGPLRLPCLYNVLICGPATSTYAAVAKTLKYLGDRSDSSRPHVYSVLDTNLTTHQQVIDAFRARIRELKQLHSDVAYTDVPGSHSIGNKFVAVIDSISSYPGLVRPWRELVQLCAEEGVWSVVDAAHSIGQEVRENDIDGEMYRYVHVDSWISILPSQTRTFGCLTVTNGSMPREAAPRSMSRNGEPRL